jgi:hypothetical protein
MAEIRKGTACSWGVGTSTVVDYGRVTGFRHSKNAAETLLLDQEGDISTFIWHGVFEEGELDILPVATTFTTPTIGDALAITDTLGTDQGTASGIAGKYYVTKTGSTQVIGDAVRLTVSVKRAAGITT